MKKKTIEFHNKDDLFKIYKKTDFISNLSSKFFFKLLIIH